MVNVSEITTDCTGFWIKRANKTKQSVLEWSTCCVIRVWSVASYCFKLQMCECKVLERYVHRRMMKEVGMA